MGLEVYYPSDIQNALRAAEQSSGAALEAANQDGDPYLTGYQAGYRAALVTLALAFGLSVPQDRRRGIATGASWQPVPLASNCRE